MEQIDTSERRVNFFIHAESVLPFRRSEECRDKFVACIRRGMAISTLAPVSKSTNTPKVVDRENYIKHKMSLESYKKYDEDIRVQKAEEAWERYLLKHDTTKVPDYVSAYSLFRMDKLGLPTVSKLSEEEAEEVIKDKWSTAAVSTRERYETGARTMAKRMRKSRGKSVYSVRVNRK
jgi:hypothetical protein